MDLEYYEKQTEVFKVLTHPVRLAILDILRDGEYCVCHINSVLGLRQSYLSQQLRVLREAGFIQDRKEGWNVYYHVINEKVYACMENAIRYISLKYDIEAPSLKPENCTCPSCAPDAEEHCTP